MPDVYASIQSAEEAVQERLADVLEPRADTLAAAGRLGEDAADALKAEAGCRA